MTATWLWVAFTAFVLIMLTLDLGVFHRKAHAVSTKEAGAWSAAWVSLALLFAAGIYKFMGRQPALEFLTGYVGEEALSVDNLFVFILLFSYFRSPPALCSSSGSTGSPTSSAPSSCSPAFAWRCTTTPRSSRSGTPSSSWSAGSCR